MNEKIKNLSKEIVHLAKLSELKIKPLTSAETNERPKNKNTLIINVSDECLVELEFQVSRRNFFI